MKIMTTFDFYLSVKWVFSNRFEPDVAVTVELSLNHSRGVPKEEKVGMK